jgi:molybdopterin-binding protein
MPVTIVGSNTPTAGGVGYGDGANVAFTGAGTSGQVLVSNGSSAPGFSSTISSATLSSPTLTNPTVSAYTETVVALGTVTSSATIAISSGTVITATLTASTACTFTMPTATAGKSFVLLLKQAASTGNGTATFTGVKWPTAGAPTITATAGKMDILTFISDGTNWYGTYVQGYTP